MGALTCLSLTGKEVTTIITMGDPIVAAVEDVRLAGMISHISTRGHRRTTFHCTVAHLRLGDYQHCVRHRLQLRVITNDVPHNDYNSGNVNMNTELMSLCKKEIQKKEPTELEAILTDFGVA
ncbi:hypothetical protein DM860_011083 [Cuscuta australis]|uniref:Uncharacterized protein n=1 Tax=Cuscuta australis TaxID=267555 RepID=A0A328E573_9ASTE|nr:hypothetical protein DM860_011083 [Cuscuta australis]